MDVRYLGADEAWDLFCERIGEVTLESHPDIPELARIVVERCRGSPLALSVIGVTMTGKTLVQEWRYAIDALTLSAAKFSGMEDEILPVFKFSYDNLKDERVKQCFLYCALFPKDHISKEDLVEYWIDEGIIDGKEDRYRAEEEGYEIFRYLVHACLLIDHKFGHYVTMPTLVRDMALWVASNFGKEKENFIVKAKANLDDIPNVKDWRGVSRMSLLDNKIKNISCSPDCPKLTTLFLQENYELEKISSGFFMYMPNLVVLDLAGNVGLSELPEEVSRLVSLQYLNLSHTQIKELPRGLLKELRKLIHLNLEFTGRLKGISGISSLSNLQVLKLYCSFDLDIKLVEELQLLKHLKVLTVSGGDAHVWEQFTSIPRLASCTRSVVLMHCEVGADGISIAATSSRLSALTIYESNIREIKIDQNIDDESKSSPKTLSNTWNFRHLVNVEISECQGLRDLTWLLFAPNLVWLDVRESPQLKEIINEDKAASFMSGEADEIIPFLKLRHLDLNNLEELDSVYWSPLPFPCLVKIDVSDCPNLSKLPLNSCSASGCDLVIYGEEEWIQKLQWDEEDTKKCFTLKSFSQSKVPVAAYPQNQSELELRKRVADLEEENRSIKQRLERVERLLWQQQQEQQLCMPPQSSIQTVVHQQETGSQSNVPGMQLFQQQPNLIQKDVQQRLQASRMLPPQNVLHQQRQSQRTHPEMPSTSRDSVGNVNGDDWQEKVFQKITSMKEMYLIDLTEIYQKVSAKLQNDFLPHQPRSEQFEKLKQFKTMLERMIGFLSVPKSNIMPALTDKVDYYEKQIINFLNMHRPRVAPQQQGQLAQSQTNSRSVS